MLKNTVFVMRAGSHQPQLNRQETHINSLSVAGALEGYRDAFRHTKSMPGCGRSSLTLLLHKQLQ